MNEQYCYIYIQFTKQLNSKHNEIVTDSLVISHHLSNCHNQDSPTSQSSCNSAPAKFHNILPCPLCNPSCHSITSMCPHMVDYFSWMVDHFALALH